MEAGTRVRLTSALGVTRERGWRTRTYGTAPVGSIGTVIEMEEPLRRELVAEGWVALRIDGMEAAPADDPDYAGDALYVAAHPQWFEVVPA
jgi:hypothetical protein